MKLVPGVVVRKAARLALNLEKDSPQLLFGAGVVGMVGSTVLACRATLRMNDVLAVTQGDLTQARSMDHPNYSESDRKKDIAVIWTRGAVNTGRLYLPAIVLGGASIACLTKSHSILAERNLALTAAYTAVDEAFSKYRARVIEKHGVEEDRELRYTMEDVEIVHENGKMETVRRIAGPGEDPDGVSGYARWFDEYNKNWNREPEYNFLFLSNKQNYFNDLLQARGHIFLNEVYEELGLAHTKAGAVVGWILNGDGDNYIDFGVYDNDANINDFVNGRDGSILLDFNVDGLIYHKIGEPDG